MEIDIHRKASAFGVPAERYPAPVTLHNAQINQAPAYKYELLL